MRRPNPLPPAAPRAGADGSPDADATMPPDADTIGSAEPPDREALPEAGSAPGTEPAASLAPVIPLTGGVMSRPELGALPDAPARTAPTEDADLRLRDVWRAARARRKALRAEMRRFTARQRRRRITWIVSLGAIAALVVGTLAAAYSPLFAVERVHVVGTEQLDAAAVEAALAGQLGTPLPLVDESAVKAALVGFPLVETYTLEARPPHELVVRIVERTPIGSLQTAAGYSLVDAAGVVLSTSPNPAPGNPVITVKGGVDSRGFDAIGQVMRALPEEIRVQVTGVAASTADDVTLELGGTGATVVWGSADDSAIKALHLQKVMISQPPGVVTFYDVSSPNAIVVQ